MKSPEDGHLLAGLLNSSTVLFWLKQVSFNKGAGGDEKRDRYEFASAKVQRLPIPAAVAEGLHTKRGSLSEALSSLSRICWERGQALLALAFTKLFQKDGEAYTAWNVALPGFVAPYSESAPFEATEELSKTLTRANVQRESLRAEMVSLQEEMDWVVYAMYGLASEVTWQTEPIPLKREDRPFQIWAQAEGDFTRAVALIPKYWPDEQQQVWRQRLELIRDSEHIRRIEQPVYKRRWDEQWKVGNRWQCGQPAYDAEFIDAFSWWLSEKAEWWLEQRGDPVLFDEWSIALWKDMRIQAAWPVVAEAQHRLELWKNEQKKVSGRPSVLDPSPTAFTKFFKALVKDQLVPEGIPFGIPYDKLRMKVSAHVKSIRGKLNVPRERFNVTEAGLYRVVTQFDSNKFSDRARSSTGSNLPFA